jgi:hypothetical protein
MHIICLTPLAEGVYNDHKADHITTVPEGWAYIPEDFPLPSAFPRLGSLEAEEKTYAREVEVHKEVTRERDTGMVDEDGNAIMEEYTEMETVIETVEYTMMTVTAMTEGTLPEPVPEPDPAPTLDERVTTLEASNAEMTEALDMILSGVVE